jgi:hypothetical protein
VKKKNYFPAYHSFIRSDSSQLIDFEHLCSYILGIDKCDIGKSITYELHQFKNKKGLTFEYWDSSFCNEIINIKVHLSQANFCFDYDGSILLEGEGSGYRIYKSKVMSKNHLLLLLILKINPDVLITKFMRNSITPVIIHANECGKTHKTIIESVGGIKKKSTSLLIGWFIMFMVGKKVCGVDSSKVTFSDIGAPNTHLFEQYIFVLTG